VETVNTFFEEIKVMGHELVEKVKALIHEGNVRRIIIKDEHGHTFVEIPVTIAAVGAIFAPILAAVAALAAMAAKFTIVVEKARTPEASGNAPGNAPGDRPV
jgi:phage-related minor tail protein